LQIVGVCNTVLSRLKKSAIRSSGTNRFSFWASAFSFSLAQWARDQESHLPTKSLKEPTKTCPGKDIFKSYLSHGQAGIKVFFQALDYNEHNQLVIIKLPPCSIVQKDSKLLSFEFTDIN